MAGMLGERLVPHCIDQKALRAVLLAGIATAATPATLVGYFKAANAPRLYLSRCRQR